MTRRLVFGDDQSQAADVAWLWINCHDWPGWQIEAVTATPELHTRDLGGRATTAQVTQAVCRQLAADLR